MTLKPATMWAIMGVSPINNTPFLYTGIEYSRSDAIGIHCTEKGKEWKDCQKDGDRSIKVLVTPI